MPDKATDTRTEIIEVAREQFLQHGYEGARLQKIADNIGVTKAMIHYYFNTKKELFERVYLRSLDQVFGGLSEILQKDVPLFKKIEELIESCLSIAESKDQELSFVVIESNRKREWLRPLITERLSLDLDQFEGELKEAADNYEIASVDASTLLLQIFSLCYFPILSEGIHPAIFENGESAPQKGIILDTIFNWLTA